MENQSMSNEKWVNLADLNIPLKKWEKFMELKLPARITFEAGMEYYYHNTKKVVCVDLSIEELICGKRTSNISLDVILLKYPGHRIQFPPTSVEVLIKDENWVQLGCIMLSNDE